MISKELLTAILGFEFIEATGQELLENSFGYAQGLRMSCSRPLKNDEWICIRNNELTFGFKDIRPEVIKNSPEGVYTSRTINIFEVSNMCKEWAFKNGFALSTSPDNIDSIDEEIAPSGNILYWSVYINSEHITRKGTEAEAIFEACQWILEKERVKKDN